VNATRRRGGVPAAVLPALALVAAGFGCAGCGGASGPAASIAVTTDISSSPYPPVPTAPQLDAEFRSAINPALPDGVRTGLVQDGAQFESALPDLYRALRDNPRAGYGIVAPVFDNHDGSITATMRLDRDGAGTRVQSMPVRFLAIDGVWKLSHQDLCGILGYADYHTPACD
jgi:hypothetical protein